MLMPHPCPQVILAQCTLDRALRSNAQNSLGQVFEDNSHKGKLLTPMSTL